MLWRDIPGDWMYRYVISETGLVRKLQPNGRWVDIAAALTDRNMYAACLVTVDGKRKAISVSRLVWSSFVGEIPPGNIIQHKVNMATDCSLANLECVPRRKQRKNTGARRAVVRIDRCGRVTALYNSVTEAARHNYLSRAAVSAACNGEMPREFSYRDFSFRFDKNLDRYEVPTPAAYHSKPVAKIDSIGNVVEVYRSVQSAADDSGFTISTVSYHCHGKVLKPQFKLISWEEYKRYERLRKAGIWRPR